MFRVFFPFNNFKYVFFRSTKIQLIWDKEKRNERIPQTCGAAVHPYLAVMRTVTGHHWFADLEDGDKSNQNAEKMKTSSSR